MSDPVVLRILRPFANEQEYLAAEAWTIEDRSIVLVDQDELAKDTLVRFEVVLEDGSRPIRAEGKVSRHVPPTGERPGGLKVRFRRFDAATKRFIERAVAERQSQRRSRRPPPAAPLVLDDAPAEERSVPSTSAPESVAPSAPSASAPDSIVPSASEPESVASHATAPDAPQPETSTTAAVDSAPPRSDRSGVRPRVVSPPPNRDELLTRLRERAARLAKARISERDVEEDTG